MVFRLTRFLNRGISSIQAQFSESIDTRVSIENIVISSNLANVPDLEIRAVEIDSDIITISTSPQFPMALYTLQFVSTDEQAFVDVNGDLLQDGLTTNSIQFLGLEKDNDVRTSMLDGLSPVYNVENDTLVRKHISNVADVLLRTRADIDETGNANYLSVDVVDEIRTRGTGPTDRLSNEGVYKITRVSTNPTGGTSRRIIDFSSDRATEILETDSEFVNTQIVSFPSDPVSLKTVSIIDEIVSNRDSTSNKYVGLKITLNNSNISQLHSCILRQSDGTEIIYDIALFGYAILENRYDTTNGSKLLTLENNEIQLSESSILSGDFQLPDSDASFLVSYAYIDNGVNIVEDSVEITQLKEKVREPVGAFLTTFYLSGFPIVDESGNSIDIDGVDFLDPSPAVDQPFTTIHPAFADEIGFDASHLPAEAGEYSINYDTGQVFVYGASSADGTGSSPPVASYNYLKSFVSGIDFNIDLDEDEISANSSRALIGEEVSVAFRFERVLAEGVDYEKSAHIEVPVEEVENRLVGAFRVLTKNTPITAVFRIFNETTGEVYTLTNFSDTTVSFSGREAPRVKNQANEPATFARIFNEPLFPSEVLESNSTLRKLRLPLQNNQIIAETNDSIGSNINSSVFFTKPELFLREFFYDEVNQSVAENISKLSIEGDYLIDHVNGIVYLYTDVANTDFGEISYEYGEIDTLFQNILSPNSLDYRTNTKSEVLLAIETPTFTSTKITSGGLVSSPERFLASNTELPIILGSKQYGVAGQRTVNSNIFVALDAQFEAGVHDDGNHIIRFSDDSDRQIVSVISTSSVEVDVPFTDSDKNITWVLVDFDFSDGYTAITNYDIQQIRAVYSIPELQSLDGAQLTNLFDPLTDTFDANVITFTSDAIKAIPAGTALAVDYSFANLYVGYTYLQDNILISYEYGDNSLNFSISDTLSTGDQYYVSYSYGALRDNLALNFGSLTQIPELSVFPLDFDREIYRSGLRGALQAFASGPTVDAIKKSVSLTTEVDPNIQELTFNEWTSDRDNLYLDELSLNGEEKYSDGKYGFGILIDGTTTLDAPAEAYLSLREGTMEAWVRPSWRGIDNDATLIFDIGQDNTTSTDGYDGYGISDGYTVAPSDIYIGAVGFNPDTVPFSISRFDEPPLSPIGKPSNFGLVPGYFIWYDEDINEWMLRAVADPNRPLDFTGTITTSGEFYNVRDGYEVSTHLIVNEGLDSITSTDTYISFSLLVDGYEAASADGYVGFDGYDGYSYVGVDGYLYQDGLNFSSDEKHFLFDTGPSTKHNRMSVFKDGSGYLNFNVLDKSGSISSSRIQQYGISRNIQDWLADESHHIAASWRFNSAEGIDQLHLFVDGQEVSNNFKYGGRPIVETGDVFRTTGSEVLTTSAAKNVIGGVDGVSTSGSDIFTSDSADFVGSDIVVGDSFSILDATADGLGGPYTVVSVIDGHTIQISSPLLLTLNDVSYSVNQFVATTETPLDIEKITVIVLNTDGETSELNGVDAENPDYTVEKSGADDIIRINNGISVGDNISIQTLGLTRGRIREQIYSYSSDNILRTNLPAPFSLDDVQIFKVIGKRASIINGGEFNPGDGYGDGSWSLAGNQLSGTFTNLSSPSNAVVGKTLKLTLGGTSNINFAGVNKVVIHGSSSGGPVIETITFSQYGSQTTSTKWISFTSFVCTFTGIDTAISFGSLEILEAIALTVSEASGDYASVARYDNGQFVLNTFGSGGLSFNISPSYYIIDYPIELSIRLNQKGRMFIGSDIDGNNQWNGALDEFVMLNEMLMDIRTGEVPVDGQRYITSDYNSLVELDNTSQTTALFHFNKSLDGVSTLYTTFDSAAMTGGNSVNSSFGDCGVFLSNDAQILDNAETIVSNNQGSIEFWVSPFIDTLNDLDTARYYIDVSAGTEEIVSATTKTLVVLPRRASKIISVRLTSDDGSGIDYFTDGNLEIDGKTLHLGSSLPSISAKVVVRFISIDNDGNRMSIYKDGYGSLNFEIVANDAQNVYQISYPIVWFRNTWHRVMATWDLNNLDNHDRIRLFVDGVEGGTVVYGTPGLLYGIGTLYGQSAVGSLDADFLTTNIDLTDTFSRIHIGNSFDELNPCKARLDNIRFSNIVRSPSVVAEISVDLNYNANLETVLPVIEDDRTTKLLDYDRDPEATEFLSNLLSEATPLFLFDVEIVDSFRKISDNERAQNLLRDVINRIKPAHTKSYISFTE